MKNKELYDLLNGLSSVGQLAGVKFAYAVARNKAKIKPLIDDLQKVLEATKEFIEFEDARKKVCEAHAVLGADAKPVIKDGRFDILDKANFEAEIDALKAKYPGVMEGREQQVAEFNKLLDEDVQGLELHKVDAADLPQGITENQLTPILPIVKE